MPCCTNSATPETVLRIEEPATGSLVGWTEWLVWRERGSGQSRAMREVGAAISTKFAQQPQIKVWLAERLEQRAA